MIAGALAAVKTHPCPGQPDASHELFLEGTKPDCTGSQPSPTPVGCQTVPYPGASKYSP